jgi:hypothetical protein
MRALIDSLLHASIFASLNSNHSHTHILIKVTAADDCLFVCCLFVYLCLFQRVGSCVLNTVEVALRTLTVNIELQYYDCTAAGCA